MKYNRGKRRATELFLDRRFASKFVKSKKVYSRKKKYDA